MTAEEVWVEMMKSMVPAEHDAWVRFRPDPGSGPARRPFIRKALEVADMIVEEWQNRWRLGMAEGTYGSVNKGPSRATIVKKVLERCGKDRRSAGPRRRGVLR